MIAAIVCLGALVAARDSPLLHEPNLAHVITARAEAETVGEFLKRIGEETKVRLSASSGVADDVIILYAKAPAREVLDRIAMHFEWTWIEDDAGFILVQSRAQRSKEVVDREELILRPYLRWQQRAKGYLKTKNENHAELTSLIEQNRNLLDSYQEEYYSDDQVRRKAWSDKYRDLESKIAALARGLSPTWSVTDELIASLTKQDLLDLDRLSRLVFAAPNTSWQRPFKPNVSTVSRELLKAWISVPDSRLRGPEREYFDALDWPHAWSENAGEAVGVRVVLKPYSFPTTPDDRYLPVETTLSLLGTNGSEFARAYMSDRLTRRRAAVESARRPLTKDRFDELLRVSAQLKEANENDSKRLLKGSTLQQFLTSNSKVHPFAGTARIIVELATAAGVNIVSDCYQTRRWLSQRPVPLGTARGALDALARAMESEWTSDGDWVQVRSKYWQIMKSGDDSCSASLSRA